MGQPFFVVCFRILEQPAKKSKRSEGSCPRLRLVSSAVECEVKLAGEINGSRLWVVAAAEEGTD
jgi:hypothetical protein